MDSAQVDAYLRRIGVERPARPTADALRELHLRHLRSVPFENLSIHLGEEIVLEEERLVDKVVGAGRGGFCYEVNGAFGALLGALGYEVALLAGRVFGEGRLGVPYDHMALRVRAVDGSEWLADVGFGAHSHLPLVFGERGSRSIRAGSSGSWRRGRRGTWTSSGTAGPSTGWRCGPVSWGTSWPARGGTGRRRSRTSRGRRCVRGSRRTGKGDVERAAAEGDAGDGAVEERELAADEEVLAAYREWFGIVLDRVPVVREAGRQGGAG